MHRARRRAVLAHRALVLALLPALLAGTATLVVRWSGPAAAGTAKRVTCGRPAPRTAAGFQRMFDALDDPRWVGGDGAFSVPLPDGRTLWAFGDTVQGRRTRTGGLAPGARIVRNSLIVQRGGCLVPVTGPRGGEVVPGPGDGTWYWPQQGYVDRDRLYLFALRLRGTGPGPFDFRVTGTDLAVFALRAGRPPRLLRVVATPSTHSDDARPQWGAAVVRIGGTVYVYGTARDPAPFHFGKALYVARVRPDRVTDPAAWRYWDGHRWVDRAAGAAALVGSVGGVSQTLSVAPTRRGVVAVSKRDEFVGRDVVEWDAPTPWGPFRARAGALATEPSGKRPGEVWYLPTVHPQFPLASGRTLLTICRNNVDVLRELRRDRRFYRPQFREVRLGAPPASAG